MEIQSLNSRAQKASERRLRYKLDAVEASNGNNLLPNNLPSSSVDEDRRLPALHGDESRLVGMAGNKEKVMDLLNKGDMHRRVVSMVGSGGLGKTTLATTVYTSAAVQRDFQARAFVAVSQAYNLRPLLESLLRQLLPRPSESTEADPLQGVESWDIHQLIQRSKDYLRDKRYLVILDDVWSSTPWEQLKFVFPDNGEKSRVIVTTRSADVARSCASSSDDIYKIEALGEQESKQLLIKTVFGSEETPSEDQQKTLELEEVCKAIFKKSGGFPLAVVSIGGMLAQRKIEPVEWKQVIERIPYELQKDKMLDRMRRIISLSYNDLPYHQKSCFLYLSAFPEDHEIRRGPLVRRWEAEGFISEVHGLSMEEIAKDYFYGFVYRNVVIPEQLASSGEVRSFRVHDIMLDIITTNSIQENLMSTLRNQQHSTVGHDMIRRVSIHPGSRDNYFPRGSFRHVRSLTIMGTTQKPKDIVFRKLKLLRVLDLDGCRWSLSDKDLEEICNLSLLRYLSLRRTGTERLPSKLGKLKGLVTLDVRQTKVTHFPKGITKLQNLQHLLAGGYVHYTRTHSVKHFDYKRWNQEVVTIPSGLSKMTALRRISFVDVKGTGLEALQEVAKLSQLTRLSVINTDSDASWGNFSDSLSELNNSLRYLSVMQDEGDCNKPGQLHFLERVKLPPIFLHSLHLLGRLGSLPPWFQRLSKLASLSLRHNYLGPEIVGVLGALPSLASLKLYDGAYDGTELSFRQGQFPVLKQLVIDSLHNLENLSFESGALGNLERLTLYLPRGNILGIRSLLKLRAVELFGINDAHVVDTLMTDVNDHPNKPIRVTRDDQPPPCYRVS